MSNIFVYTQITLVNYSYFFYLLLNFLKRIFIFTLFYFTILYWFYHTLTWIRHGCTWVPNPEPPSHLSPHIISLDYPCAICFFKTTSSLGIIKDLLYRIEANDLFCVLGKFLVICTYIYIRKYYSTL